MASSNFYLDLLANQVNELEKVIASKEDFSNNTFNCILAGIVIRMDAILEECLIDFHSENFEDVSRLIYVSRQILVHYSNFKHFSDLEDTSKKIIEEFNKAYPSEKKYFEKILAYKKNAEHNVVVKKNKDIIYDEFTNCYVFNSPKTRIIVGANRVVKIQDVKKRRDVAYIVNLDSELGFFLKNDLYKETYYESSNRRLLTQLFEHNFPVIGTNYNRHKELIRDILDNFYKQNSYNAIYIKEKLPLDSKKQAIYLETSKVLDSYFNDNVVYNQFLDDKLYTNFPRPIYSYADYNHIIESAKETLENNVSSKDYFFIVKALSAFDSLNDCIVKNSYLPAQQKEALKSSLLINWVDQTIRNLTKEFVDSHKDFKKVYLELLEYRSFFAHNLLQVKPKISEETIESFYDASRGVVNILANLNIEKITRHEEPRLVRFVYLEKNIDNFVSYKGEQYLKIDDLNYVGDKLFYTSKEQDYGKIVGLVPVDKNYDFHSAYYNRINDKFVPQSVKNKNGRKRIRLVSRYDYEQEQELLVDVNLTTLLDIFASSRGKIDLGITPSNAKKIIVFNTCEENNNTSHAAYLDDIIANFFKQRYLPFELAKEIKYNVIKDDEDEYFEILDNKDNLVAIVLNNDQFKNNFDIQLDNKDNYIIKEVLENKGI